jgi:hypothetical protein
MWEFLEIKQYVRAVLDREMDGRADRVRCEKREKACYRCAASAEIRRREEVLYRIWENKGRMNPAGQFSAKQNGIKALKRSYEKQSNPIKQHYS